MSLEDSATSPAHIDRESLSFSQQRLWLFHQLHPRSLAYNTGGMLHISGPTLTENQIHDALRALVRHHPMLRVRIDDHNGEPSQRIDDSSDFECQRLDVSESADPNKSAEALAREIAFKPYTLVNSGLVRGGIYCLGKHEGKNQFSVLVAAHHMVMDAWSFQLCVKFIASYLAGKPVKPLSGQRYFEHVKDQTNASESDDHALQAAWKALNLYHDDTLFLPSHTNIQKAVYDAAHHVHYLDDHKSQLITETAKKQNVSRFELLTSVLQLVIGRYANHDHPSVCIPALNRSSKNRRTVGFYANNALLGTKIDPSITVSEFINTNKNTLRDSLHFASYPLEKLAPSLPAPTVAFNYRAHGDNLTVNDGDIDVVFTEFDVVETPFDLVLDAICGEQLSLRFVYAAEKYSRPLIESLVAAFEHALLAMCEQPDAHVASLSILPAGESEHLSNVGVGQECWSSQSFLALFEHQVKRRGDDIALKHIAFNQMAALGLSTAYHEESLSYSELDKRSNQVAHVLLQQGVQRDSIVGVLMTRGVEMLIAMIGVLKSGRAFLPLDPDYPHERLAFMLSDSKATLLITQSPLRELSESLTGLPLLNIDAAVVEAAFPLAPGIQIHPQQLAYVIYTSGSTGQPKGVALSHGGLSMHVQTIGQRYGMTPDDIELHFASISFDGAVERWTVPLAFGSRLIIRDQDLWTPEQTSKVLGDEHVTIACFPPSYVGPLLDWIEEARPVLRLRSITLGGEAFTRDTYDRIHRVISPPRIINGYGPTETVVTPLIWTAYPSDRLTSAYAPIGTAVGGRALYILDANLNPLPFGATGELYVGMEIGLARGYLDKPDLTSERFLPDPFSANGERMYRTGDLVKFSHDGSVEYLGRTDQQVKIRGFRIELGEIESRLQTLSGAECVAVVAHDTPTGKRLAGYVQQKYPSDEKDSPLEKYGPDAKAAPHEQRDALQISDEMRHVKEEEWRDVLKTQLPDYMVPSRILIQQTLPLTPAGKIDRARLLPPDWVERDNCIKATQTEEEHILAEAWSALLKVSSIGRDSHFFALGGESIAALQLIGKLRQANLSLSPKQVFDSPVLKDMALLLEPLSEKPVSQARQVGKVSLLPLQSRFIRTHQFSRCNQFASLTLADDIVLAALHAALTRMADHHDALSLQFLDSNEAQYSERTRFSLQVFKDTIDEALVNTDVSPQTGINMSVGVSLANNQIYIAIHHLVVDALSWPILLEDLLLAYQANQQQHQHNETSTVLPNVNYPAKTHHQSDWHHELQSLTISQMEMDYWHHHANLSVDTPSLFGERGEPRALVWRIDAARLDSLIINANQYAKLTRECVLFSVVVKAIASSQTCREFIVHRENHGRFSDACNINLSRSVGWHTGLFPQKIVADHEGSIDIRAVKDDFLSVPNHAIGYAAGVAQGKWSFSDHVDVLFNYLGGVTNVSLPNVALNKAGLWRDPNMRSDAGIVLNVSESDHGVLVEIEFDTLHFDDSAMLAFVMALDTAVDTMVDECLSPSVLTKNDAPMTALSLHTLADISGIAPRLPSRILPLSALQQGLYFHAQLSGARRTYVNQISLPLKGMNAERLFDAWTSLMDRHGILRSTVVVLDGQPHLIEWPSLSMVGGVVDNTSRENLTVFKQGLVDEGFELSQSLLSPSPLWRVDIISVNDEIVSGTDDSAFENSHGVEKNNVSLDADARKKTTHCIFTIHHILIDGWSTGTLLSELFALYFGDVLPPVTSHFEDYLRWVVAQDPATTEAYWEGYLSTLDAPTLLANAMANTVSRNGNNNNSHVGGENKDGGYLRHNVDVNAQTVSAWQRTLNANGLTLNTLVQAAWLLVLNRFSGIEQPTFGNTVAGRPTSLPGSENMVGLFINTLPVSSRIDWQCGVAQWLQTLQSDASAQRECSHASLADIQLRTPQHLSQQAQQQRAESLFDTLVVFENYPFDDAMLNKMGIEVGHIDSYEFTHYPLTLAVLPSDALRIVFAYNSSVFSSERIVALEQAMSHFLTQLIDNIESPLNNIPPLSATMKHQIEHYEKASERWDYVPFPTLLATQAMQCADKEALVANVEQHGGKHRRALSYHDVHQQSDAVAAALITRGVVRDQRIGVMFNRGNDMLVAMIGVMKAGAAFLPLDPSYPADRLAYMLNDSNAQCLLVDDASISVSQSIWPATKTLSYSHIDLNQTLSDAPTLLPEQLAYVIYTSGSTGKPKGVCVSHAGLSMHVQTIGQCYGMTPDDVELHFASISFDGAIERWTVPLAFGSTLVIRDQTLWSAEQTCTVLEREQVSIACFPPSYVGPLLEWIENTSLSLNVRSWTLGGEAFTRETYFNLQRVISPKRIINGYGPTETVVTPMIWKAYPDTPLESAYAPIGKAVGDRALYVLDGQLLPVPAGVVGELYIGNEIGLARGYLDRADLTSERFLPDPFNDNGERMYRTGDLVRWRDDGVMDYIGRTDDQIKIRGFRIELGEIESQLQRLSHAEHVAVVAFEGAGGQYLVGYLQGSSNALDTSAILTSLSDSLPDYMVPSALCVLPVLPLTPASKVDKKRLPQPEGKTQKQANYAPPEGLIETALAEEWQRIFDREVISRYDDFFALGGQSLLATQLVGRLQQHHKINLPLQRVFDNGELLHMARHCEQSETRGCVLARVPRFEFMPASASQKRLWLVQQLMPESAAYHMPLALSFDGIVNLDVLERALQHIVEHHDILRTSFVQRDGELMQHVHDANDAKNVNITLRREHVSTLSSVDAFRHDVIAEPFSLDAPTPLRAVYIDHGDAHGELLLVVHHIVSDGISMQWMLKELSAYYLAEHGISDQQTIERDLSADDSTEQMDKQYECCSTQNAETSIELDYIDYAAWQQKWLQSLDAKEALRWWESALKHDIDPLILYSDVARDQQGTSGHRYHFDIPLSHQQRVEKLASTYSTTPFNVMLSLWHLLMHKRTGRDEIWVGVPVAGRTLPDTESMQGCFINNLVIPAHFDVSASFEHLLLNVKGFSEQALARQHVPFEVIVESLGISGRLQHHPLFQTSFNLQYIDTDRSQAWGDITVTPFDPGAVDAQLELSLDVQQFKQGLWSGFINYAAPIFDHAFADSLCRQWFWLLEQVAENSETLIENLSLVEDAEHQYLNACNATSKEWGSFTPPPVAIIEQARATPHAIAVTYKNDALTYADFDERVNQLAHWLREQGIKEETRVAISLPRSIDLIVGIHAITRAGGAYVPLDSSYPEERLRYILDTANVELLLTDAIFSTRIDNDSTDTDTIRIVDIASIDTMHLPTYPPTVNWHPSQALYVIFTSGSTGLPKGVVNTQGALQNRLGWMQEAYALDADDCVLQKTPFSFDVSVWEFFWPLMVGARLAVAEPESHRQPALLHNIIRDQNVTTLHFVPSMLHAFLSETAVSECESLSRIICSGEALPAELAGEVLTQLPQCELHNLYGPTEAAIDVSHWQCELPMSQRVPIGHPIANTQLYVLDDALNVLPVGVPGELYLAGDGLAREYLGRADLTAERFIPNPWGETGSRLYRTGDQVVRHADGRLDYLGRLDNQVKIRGLRIELEEIETVINALDDVSETAVIAHDAQTGTQLVAYVVSQLSLSDVTLAEQASKHLPEYMVPTIWISLDAMPLSPNGKRDRNALPAPEWHSVAYRAPQSELEIWFVRAWESVLQHDDIGLDDNFFALGGHSLLATKVVAKAQQELGLSIALRDFFEAKTLQALTDKLQSSYQQYSEQETDELDAMAALMDDLELL
ncbi:amino acid adenylation domain-containing protein [Enterovibrio calviensis]|uniref:amino acid adenylation domain-containing protein n=1 Tax=Enterovibrio calviensis TaxID=91359 RepID=UPI00373627C6